MLPLPAIRPISDLRTDLNGVCEDACETQQPIFMTKNGKATLVVMDCAAYDRPRQHDRYVMKMREAEIEAQYHPESLALGEVGERMERIFATWGV